MSTKVLKKNIKNAKRDLKKELKSKKFYKKKLKQNYDTLSKIRSRIQKLKEEEALELSLQRDNKDILECIIDDIEYTKKGLEKFKSELERQTITKGYYSV